VSLDSVIVHAPKRIEKSWGYELWIHNDADYCGKLLVFTKIGNKFSMHYHMKKKETWYIQSGRFRFNWIDTETAQLHTKELVTGDSVVIQRGLPHQLEALASSSVVFEVSTEHFDDDSYRIYKNDPSDLIL